MHPIPPSSLVDLICAVAEVPSFSSFEERLHPLVRQVVAQIPGATLQVVAGRNLIARIPGKGSAEDGARTVALTAHLDKINHFGEDRSAPLPVGRAPGDRLRGLLDNAVGVGICLHLGLRAAAEEFPPLWLLFSEMEESTGLRKHPQLLRDGGAGCEHGMGARRLTRELLAAGEAPSEVITVDTTPRLRDAGGLALYTDHWEYTGATPSPQLVRRTEELAARLLALEPTIQRLNSTNDYLTYGKRLNEGAGPPVVSVALEPAVWPYHEAQEEVRLEDIQRVSQTLARCLRAAD